jgi:hypothetical protein
VTEIPTPPPGVAEAELNIEPPRAACDTLTKENQAHTEALSAAMTEALGGSVKVIAGSNRDGDVPGCSLVVTGNGVELGLGDRTAASEGQADTPADHPKDSPWTIWTFNRRHLEVAFTAHGLSMSGPGASGVTEEMTEYAVGLLRCDLTSGWEIDDWSICDTAGALGYCDALDRVPPEQQTHRYALQCREVAQEEG